MEAKGDCEFFPTCPIFTQFTMKSLTNIWIALYCKGSKQSQCARKRLREKGEDVPVTLLPSGQYLMPPNEKRDSA
jgi:hypothetical protein